jgi:RNase P/RNase MRP subunit p29
MGTGVVENRDEHEVGILPQVIKEVFNQIDAKQERVKIIVKVSFI